MSRRDILLLLEIKSILMGEKIPRSPFNSRHSQNKVFERFHDMINDAPVTQSLLSAFIIKRENVPKLNFRRSVSLIK